MFKRVALLLGLAGALAALGALLAVNTGSARSSGGRALVFSGGPGSFKFIDVAPKGPSAGDIAIFGRTVSDTNGKPVGRAQFACIGVIVRGFDQCTGTLILGSGRIVIAGAVGQTNRATFAVVGGTGAYEGARGSFTSVMLKNGRSRITVHLLSSP